MAGELVIKVFDKDMLADDSIGSTRLPLSSIPHNQPREFVLNLTGGQSKTNHGTVKMYLHFANAGPQGGHPQQGGYPPQGGYPQQGGYPPQGGYPQQGGYPNDPNRQLEFPGQGYPPGPGGSPYGSQAPPAYGSAAPGGYPPGPGGSPYGSQTPPGGSPYGSAAPGGYPPQGGNPYGGPQQGGYPP